MKQFLFITCTTAVEASQHHK